MRIFLAGASGLIGIRLVPLLVAEGHEVRAMTRSPEKLDGLQDLGGDPVLCDVFDRDRLEETVIAFRPDVVMDQLTDLPDDVGELPQFSGRNNRVRDEGTRNLLRAARSAGAATVITQSVAWDLPSEEGRRAVLLHEQLVLDAGGVVIRYGQFYGPGTYWPGGPPPPPAIQIGAAARRTVPVLHAPPGIVVIAE
jgi:nucleoside-diphosphate-sugar epimerase